MHFKIAWRMFWRELRKGELLIIAFALIIAVVTVVSLTGITESVRSALMQRSSSFMAADKVLRSTLPFNQNYFNEAKQLDLQTAMQMQFNTMIFAGDAMQLVSVKAVSAEYPLRGNLELRAGAEIVALTAGQVFVEKRILQLLNLNLGDKLNVGASELVIGGVIEQEPDAPTGGFTGQPRLMMHIKDVAATQVVQPGSQISYRYLFAGTAAQLQILQNKLEPKLTPSDRWQQVDRSSAIGSALDRAEKFLLLAGLLGIVLAACASAVAATRYSERHRMAVAVIKALGMTQRQTKYLYFSQLMFITLFSMVIGLILGQLACFAAQILIEKWVPDVEPVFSVRPLLIGIATAFVCSLLFALRPVMRLAEVPALEVLRQGPVAMRFDIIHLISGAFAVFGLMWMFSQDWQTSAMLFLGCALFAGVLMLVAATMVRIVKPVAAGQSSALKLALANLRRRLWANSFQLITFSLAIFLTLLLYFIRSELISQWQAQVPANAPNNFMVNITSEQKPQLTAALEQEQLVVGEFYPMISGRMISVNGEILQEPEASDNGSTEQQAKTAKSESRRQGFGRELNLTWLDKMPANNQITAGQWFTANTVAEVSVEVRSAERMKLKLGDKMIMSIGGQEVSATVTSFRKVDWNSLQPNFFVILSPDLMTNFPATYMTAVHIPASANSLLNQVSRQFPTVSVISVSTILKQINEIISQVSVALSVIMVLVFAAAVLVLIAQVQASLDQREQEIAILRTLGATKIFLLKAIVYEYLVLGLLAGGFATLLVEVLLSVLQVRLFELPFQLHPMLWWMGPALGGSIIVVLAMMQLRGLLNMPSGVLLRRALHA